MNEFLTYLVNGISLGGIYALIALGFVIVFKATEVVNFAHGTFVVLGAYVIARTQADLPFALSALLGILASTLGMLAVERLFVRKLMQDQHGANALAILTIGIDIVVVTELGRRFGPDILPLGDPWGNKLVDLGPVTLPQARLAGLVVVAVLLAAFYVAFTYSSWGIAMRAGAEDGEAAALMGIRRGRVTMTAWAVAGALAAIAAIFLCSFPTPGADAALRFTALRAFPAAILGGLDSTLGAVVGGVAIGITETMVSGYDVTYSGNSLVDVMPYVVMIAVLLFRPSGLFGTKELTRV
jgi:branched-chain amino acid transport system permease protein